MKSSKKCERSKGGEDTLKEGKWVIHFATKNKDKYNEAARVASEHGIVLIHLNLEKHEIQSEDLSKIAAVAAEQALHESKADCVVAEDAGFFVDALNGFPGPYSSYVYGKLGVHGILMLLQEEDRRDASFASAVAYCSRKGRSVCFEGTVKGQVSLTPRGQHGFGFDPIFIPDQSKGRTFAEMRMEEKNRFSHRAIAFSKFFNWIRLQGPDKE